MIEKALARRLAGVVFTRIDEVIPLPGESVDVAVGLNVFIEIRTLAEMTRICREVARTLRPGSRFFVESTSPLAFGHTFRSYRYPAARELRSGEVTPCIVTTPAGELVIDDTYWTEADYVSALREAGLTITAIGYPMPRDPSAWSTDEALLSPCIVLTATKLAIAGGWVRACESSRTGLCGRRPGCGSRFRPITADCTLVGAVQPAVLSAVLAVAVVLKLVLMPDDARLLDCRVLVIIHMHTSPHH